MNTFPEGNAIVYCDGAFNTSNGKTAHGLVRHTERYKVLSVIDKNYAGLDSGKVLDGKPNGIPILNKLEAALVQAKSKKIETHYFVIGIAPDGGRLNPEAKASIKKAMQFGLNVDSGLHDFLSEDENLSTLANACGIKIRDVRKPPPRSALHFFEGKIEDVDSFKVALLGTDSAVGKRTTAWILMEALRKAGHSAEIIGTGQTAWMQGAKYGIILDSLINDFVSGEIEHVVWSAWNEVHPDFIIIEGQGSLMNPAYPGGFEILAAGRPDVVILQHAPVRKDYDGFPGYPIHPIKKQIEAIELISGKPVIAITINHEVLNDEEIPTICEQLEKETNIPVWDVLLNEPTDLANLLIKKYKKEKPDE